jgi:stearoyl-CoA desaturase (Delta-9 desaturase)
VDLTPTFHPLLALAIGLVVAQLGILATTVYLHRGLAHRGLTLNPVVSFVLRFFLWLSTGMKAREWVAVHRRHHAASDTPDDPHSPLVLGFWRVQLANAALYRRTARDGETVGKYARDLPPDVFDRVLFDHSGVGLGVGITALCLVVGWPTGLLAAGIHLVAYIGLSGAINAVGHTYGSRPHDNKATNGRLLALITSGEGLHNNHHAMPTSARFSQRFGEIDPAWWVIRVLSLLGLARVRHRSAPAAEPLTSVGS